jgi:TolB-like protein
MDLAPAKSIAVLPFENLSPDKENEFFADGMHDEVITSLTKIHDLTVISRPSVMAYRKPEDRSLRKIAAELGVAAVLEGSVQRAGSRVKVSVQLIDARTDVHLWADSYTEEVTDVFAIQSKLAGAITLALKATLSPQEKSLIARRPTQNQEAYDLYLRGRTMSDTLGLGSLREHYDRMVALYEQAIARDPAFALAHVQLCITHGYLYWFGNLDPSPARRARAKAAMDAALRLAPEAPETTLALGAYSYLCENDWGRALAEYRAAEGGLPNDAQLLYFIGLTLRRLGRLPEALASFARSVELNPRDVNCPVAQIETLNALRRFSESRTRATRYVAQFPGDPVTHHYLTVARLELDRDRPAYFRQLEANPLAAGDPHGLIKAYRLAMARGDLAAADQALADPRVGLVRGAGGIINEPAALHRALVAFLLGRRDVAGRLADEALASFGAEQWSPRQTPWVMTARALAHALAGRAEEAIRQAGEGFAAQAARDAFALIPQRPGHAQVFLVLDRREQALAVLREMMTEPCEIGPEQVRLDPLWSRLKSDPRFEEILKTAKPL